MAASGPSLPPLLPLAARADLSRRDGARSTAASWHATDGSEVTFDADAAQQDYVLAVRYDSSVAPRIAACMSTRSVAILDASTLRSVLELSGHRSTVFEAHFGRAAPATLWTASDDSTVRMWDLRSGASAAVVETLQPCRSVALDGGGGGVLMAAASGDSVRFWDTRRLGAGPLGAFDSSHSEPVTQVLFHPIARSHVLTCAEDGLLNVFDSTIRGEDDALLATYTAAAGIQRMGVFGAGGSAVWAVTMTSALSLYALGGGEASPPLIASYPALPDACQATGVPCDFLVDCHFDPTSSRLLCLGGSSEGGQITLLEVSDRSARPIGSLGAATSSASSTTAASAAAATATSGSGHSDSVRCVDWMTAGDGGALVGCVTGGEDGSVCLWTDVSTMAAAAAAAAAVPAAASMASVAPPSTAWASHGVTAARPATSGPRRIAVAASATARSEASMEVTHRGRAEHLLRPDGDGRRQRRPVG